MFFAAFSRIFVFSAAGTSKKHIVSENSRFKRVFKKTGVVLAGTECSPKIIDFRASGVTVQESEALIEFYLIFYRITYFLLNGNSL